MIIRQPQIKDKINLNNFGVLFHTAKSIEDFQELSGMSGGYSKEYQHHYWNARGRLKVQNQILDIAIPLVMVHYHQEVGGASVEFNLGEVGVASEAAKNLALKKFQELARTDFYKKLVNDYSIVDWELVPMNTFHVHPTGVNSFSGTDLRADINHPGVCYPLNTGENIANFAGILQHKENFAEIIHNEYRIFNAKENTDRVYEKGRCLTIIRGFSNPPEEPEEFPGNGIIDTIFGTTRPVRVHQRMKDRKSVILKNGFAPNEGKEFSEEFAKIWDECNFEIDTTLIDEKNVIVGMGRLQQRGTINGMYNPWNKKQNKTKEKANNGLFGIHATHKSGQEGKKLGNMSTIEMEMINALGEKGYEIEELAEMPRKELEELYDVETEADEIERAHLNKKVIIDVEDMIDSLFTDNIISMEKLMMMSAESIKSIYNEIYQ